jgi:hypothetical protein
MAQWVWTHDSPIKGAAGSARVVLMVSAATWTRKRSQEGCIMSEEENNLGHIWQL